MRSRTGKIARLPFAVRQELNRRLFDGATTDQVLAWLNPLPEARAVLAELFAGRPVIQQNLSCWRLGGYQEWLDRQQAQELLEPVNGGSDNRPPAGDEVAAACARAVFRCATILHALREASRRPDTDARTTRRLVSSAIQGLVVLRRTQAKLREELLRMEDEEQAERPEAGRLAADSAMAEPAAPAPVEPSRAAAGNQAGPPGYRP